jgi:hypothetical protein
VAKTAKVRRDRPDPSPETAPSPEHSHSDPDARLLVCDVQVGKRHSHFEASVLTAYARWRAGARRMGTTSYPFGSAGEHGCFGTFAQKSTRNLA